MGTEPVTAGAARRSALPGRVLGAAVPMVIGGLLVASGHRWGWVPIAGGVVLLLPGVGPVVARRVARVAAVAGEAVGIGAFVLAHLVLLMPVWAVSRVVRRDPVAQPPGWQPVPGVAARRSGHRQFRPARPATARAGLAQRVWNVAGVLVVLALLDYGVGWAYDSVRHPEMDAVQRSSTIRVPVGPAPLTLTPTTEPPFVTGTVPPDDERLASGPFADIPWAAEYFWGVDANTRQAYPFLIDKPTPLRTPYFNVSGWERKSYQAPDTEDAPLVWFFGGSTMFGMGQRDEYTIPSAMARIAEAAGTPVRVRNFGQPRWLNWQEVLLFEQLLATEETPDAVVFYDGINDVNNQLVHPFAQPSYLLFTGALDTPPDSRSDPAVDVEAAEARTWWDALTEAYSRHSVSGRIWDKLVPSAAAQQPDPAAVPKTLEQAQALAERVHTIYARGRDLAELLAEDHGVEPFFYWQPQALVRAIWFDETAKAIDPPTVDLTRALDAHRDYYFDTMHTVEPGAVVIAEAQWETVGPAIRAWYEDRGR